MFTLEEVVPWGRSFAEYQQMFALTENDLRRSILGCGDGPASFNAEATRQGVHVVSCDPLYQFSKEQIRGRIESTSATILEQARRNHDSFVWNVIPNVDELAVVRSAAMDLFLNDYESGLLAGRYRDASLPSLPYAECAFDLALCSHLLFLYSDQLSPTFHISAALEMCRVAHEVRIFPIVALNGIESSHLGPVRDALHAIGMATRVEQVRYEFQRGANQMLRITPD